MNDLETKIRVIRMIFGENCLFCEKSALNSEYLKERV